jgi:hypothetical protein
VTQEDFDLLLTDVQRIVRESGRGEGFDATRWLSDWLSLPVPALGDQAPADVLQTPGGLQTVRTLLARMQSGAFS